MKTYFIFSTLPKYTEYLVDDFPILPIGTVVSFDLKIRDPKMIFKSKDVKGDFYLVKTKYIFSNSKRSGLCQYLEWSPVTAERSTD